MMNKNFRTKRADTARRAKLTSAKAIEIIERRYKIVELRRDGYTVKQISDQLGLTTATVYKELDDILVNTIIKYQETTEGMRQIQLEQIDQVIRAFTPTGTNCTQQLMVIDGREVVVTMPPDPAAARVILDAMSRRSKLMALDMPETKKLEVTGIREYIGVDMEQI